MPGVYITFRKYYLINPLDHKWSHAKHANYVDKHPDWIILAFVSCTFLFLDTFFQAFVYPQHSSVMCNTFKLKQKYLQGSLKLTINGGPVFVLMFYVEVNVIPGSYSMFKIRQDQLSSSHAGKLKCHSSRSTRTDALHYTMNEAWKN